MQTIAKGLSVLFQFELFNWDDKHTLLMMTIANTYWAFPMSQTCAKSFAHFIFDIFPPNNPAVLLFLPFPFYSEKTKAQAPEVPCPKSNW